MTNLPEGPWSFELDDRDPESADFTLSTISVDAADEGRLRDYGRSIIEGTITDPTVDIQALGELLSQAPVLVATVTAQREVIERLGSKFDDALNILADLSAGTPCPPEYPGKGPCEMHGWMYPGTCPQGLAHAFRAEWSAADTAALQTEHQARREVIGALVGALEIELDHVLSDLVSQPHRSVSREFYQERANELRATLARAKEAQ